MSTTLEQIIADLEKVASPAETAPTVENNDTQVENQDNDTIELRKLAEEYDAAGRIIARGFYDELQKIAVGATGMTPNTAAEGDNPAVQLSNSDVNEAEVAKVVGVIKEQTLGAEAKNTPQGQVQADPKVTVPAGPSEAPPVAADAKQASADTVGRLWNFYFGQEYGDNN